MHDETSPSLEPVASLITRGGYTIPTSRAPIDLKLDGNEGVWPPESVLAASQRFGPKTIRNYPSARSLEGVLAKKFSIHPSRVLATAGADDALDRTCRAMLEPGREMIVAVPTFEMITRYANLSGASISAIPWLDKDPFPAQAILDAITPATRHIAIVSPNNPTGKVLSQQALEQIALAAPHALVVLDHAYVEFSPEDDLTHAALALPNVVVVRTMSKAWGLAGLRVGYILGASEPISWLRAAGNPYAVTGLSAKLAIARLEAPRDDVDAFIALAQQERERFNDALAQVGGEPSASKANFSFARMPDAPFARDLFASLGIAVRAWPDHPDRRDAIRISCPGNENQSRRVEDAIHALSPQALLLDMDGVMVDVSRSYRAAITQTCARFGVTLKEGEIEAAKRRGDANNDWILTRALLLERGVDISLQDVTDAFEALYHGDEQTPGLKQHEVALVTREALDALVTRANLKLAVVTGRPRRDALEFLRAHDLEDRFDAIVCMEDAEAKPSAAPVLKACSALGVKRAWMIGDTPDDVRAARAASAAGDVTVAGLGFAPPSCEDREGFERALIEAGAGRVFWSWSELLEKLP